MKIFAKFLFQSYFCQAFVNFTPLNYITSKGKLVNGSSDILQNAFIIKKIKLFQGKSF